MSVTSYTAIADPDVDRLVASHLTEVSSTVRRRVRPEQLAGVVLFGGYGRGEGGVAAGADEARPHNNYDLLVVLQDASPWQATLLGRQLRAASVDLERRLGVGVDLSTISYAALKQAPPQIFWYDVRRMHRIVQGPEDLLSAIPAYELDDIPQIERARLLLNRSALLAINRLIWRTSEEKPTTVQLEAMIKHVAKAVLGFGDAVLLAGGRYVVSYRKKVGALEQIAASTSAVSRDFRDLHRWATEFRFRPDYTTLHREDVDQLMTVALAEGQRIHHWFESQRLGLLAPGWADYLEHLERSDGSPDSTLRALTKLPRRVVQNLLAFGPDRHPSARSLRWLLREPLLRVMATLPAALYSDADPAYRHQAAQLLGGTRDDVLSTFVAAWARVLDPNAGPVLRKLGVR